MDVRHGHTPEPEGRAVHPPIDPSPGPGPYRQYGRADEPDGIHRAPRMAEGPGVDLGRRHGHHGHVRRSARRLAAPPPGDRSERGGPRGFQRDLTRQSDASSACSSAFGPSSMSTKMMNGFR